MCSLQKPDSLRSSSPRLPGWAPQSRAQCWDETRGESMQLSLETSFSRSKLYIAEEAFPWGVNSRHGWHSS